MKKIIDKFLKLDHPKKLAISFVCVSFLVIFSITIFNMINANQTNTEAKIVIKQQDTSKKETDKKDDEDTEEKIVEEVDANQEATTNHDTKQTTNEHSNVSDSASSNVDNIDKQPAILEIEMVSASMSIVGLNNELIASGSVSVEKGQSVYEGLVKFADENGFAITVNSPGKYAYITSIAGLYEKQHGANSGWLYQVNKVTPNLGSGHIKINQDDQIIWYYTHD